MNALATAPGVIATPGKYYIGAQEVMEYLDCKENKAYELIRQLRDELVKAGKLTPAYPIGKVPRKYFFERCVVRKVVANSVRQKIKIRLKWFFQEWRWDDEAGVPYFEYLFVKNPDIDQIKELIEEQIFNVDEITEVNDVSIEIDSLKRSAVIRYEAVTDEKTYKEEVKIGG